MESQVSKLKMEPVTILSAVKEAIGHSNKRLIKTMSTQSVAGLEDENKNFNYKRGSSTPRDWAAYLEWRLTWKSNSFEGLYMVIGKKHDRTKHINSFLLKMALTEEFEVRVLFPWPCLFSHPELEGPVI